MLTDKRLTVIARWFNAVNKRDLVALDQLADELYTPDFVEHCPNLSNSEPGPEGVKKGVRDMINRNPDINLDVDDILVDGEKVTTRLTARGNDRTTGKPIDLVILAIDRFDGDKIAEEWEIVAAGKW